MVFTRLLNILHEITRVLAYRALRLHRPLLWSLSFLCTPTAFFLEDAGRHPGRCAHLRRFGLEDVNVI